ncbi:Phospholipase A1 member A [Eumeta japonica]|uniref:Phospholipase A1 member A n=1 Tax=Eumeta variegata TaxID=151549 RepID=A0A4C1Y790_EUMVA|nr:Phospholipase A1 member A [Eumeta japonica]
MVPLGGLVLRVAPSGSGIADGRCDDMFETCGLRIADVICPRPGPRKRLPFNVDKFHGPPGCSIKSRPVNYCTVSEFMLTCHCRILPMNRLAYAYIQQLSACFVSPPGGRVAALGDCYVRHYTGNTTDQNLIYRFANIKDLLKSPLFDPKRRTVLYIHGYVEFHTDTSVRTVVGAYLQQGEYNALLLDWSNLAYGQYLAAATNALHVSISLLAVTSHCLVKYLVGRAAAVALHRLLSSGLAADSVHVVGHSLGAHIAGVIGRYLKLKNYTLPSPPPFVSSLGGGSCGLRPTGLGGTP